MANLATTDWSNRYSSQDIAYTIEFFPEEGKYHLSGHRKCGVRYEPEEVSTIGSACPVCGRAMTLGVMQRVEDLAQREAASVVEDDGMVTSPDGRPPYRSLVSLQQVLSETLGVGVNTKRVRTAYMSLVETFGSEMKVLMDTPPADLTDALPDHGPLLAEGVKRVRAWQHPHRTRL